MKKRRLTTFLLAISLLGGVITPVYAEELEQEVNEIKQTLEIERELQEQRQLQEQKREEEQRQKELQEQQEQQKQQEELKQQEKQETQTEETPEYIQEETQEVETDTTEEYLGEDEIIYYEPNYFNMDEQLKWLEEKQGESWYEINLESLAEIERQNRERVSQTYRPNYTPTLNNQERVSNGAILVYKPYVKSNLTIDQLNLILQGTYMEGLGSVFKEIEDEYGFNSLFAIGVLNTEQGLTAQPRANVRRTCNPFGILNAGPGSGSRMFCLDNKPPNSDAEMKLGFANGIRRFAQNNTQGAYKRVGFLDRRAEVDVTEFGKLYCGGNQDTLWNGSACMSSSGRWDEMVVNSMNRFFERATGIRVNNSFKPADLYNIYLQEYNSTQSSTMRLLGNSNNTSQRKSVNLFNYTNSEGETQVEKLILDKKVDIENSILDFVETHEGSYNKKIYIIDYNRPFKVVRDAQLGSN